MTAMYSSEITNQNATPPLKVKINRGGARLRYFMGTYTAPATNPQIGDTIAFIRLPKGCRVIGHLGQLNVAAGTASSTLALGDAASAARHLAASSVASAAVFVPQAQSASGATFETTDDTLASGDPGSTNNCEVRGTVAGAVILVGQVLTLHMAVAQD